MTEETKDPVTSEQIKDYPKASRKLELEVKPYSITSTPVSTEDRAVTTYVTPFGLEFQGPQSFTKGTLVKINLTIPDFWERKQQFVEYRRVDQPSDIKIIGRVIECEELSKRGKKRRTLVQTLSIDEVDEKVLTSFLKDSKL